MYGLEGERAFLPRGIAPGGVATPLLSCAIYTTSLHPASPSPHPARRTRGDTAWGSPSRGAFGLLEPQLHRSTRGIRHATARALCRTRTHPTAPSLPQAEGRCRYGEQCEFAHGVHELRAKPKDLVSLPAGAGWSTYLHDGG